MKKSYVAILLAMMIAMMGLLTGCGDSDKKDEASDKMKVKINLILEDGTEEAHDIEVTDGANLRDALLEAELIDEENYGALFVETINGHTASMEEGYTWYVTDENGEQIPGFFEEITLTDGQTVNLEYYLAPYFED